MAWFKVDDGLHDHRKTRRVRKTHPRKRRDVAPFGLWVLAGSWAGDNGTGGFVPLEELQDWDDDALALAERLVDAGLWWATEVDGEEGYGFHDWDQMNPTDDPGDPRVSGAFGNHIRWHEKRGKVEPDCSFCSGVDRPDDRGDIGAISGGDITGNRSRPDPTRPDPIETRSPDDAKPDPDADFDDWWQHYPKKVGKGQARKAYRSARKKVDHDTLVAAVKAQEPKLMAKGAEFCPHPSTWLNGERWEDQTTTTAPEQPRLPLASQLEVAPSGMTDAESWEWMMRQRAARRQA